jgi:hypothetical protein
MFGVGVHGFTTANPDAFIGQFNSQMQQCIFGVLEEADSTNSSYKALKNAVQDTLINVRRMYQEGKTTCTYSHFVSLGNDLHQHKQEEEDRMMWMFDAVKVPSNRLGVDITSARFRNEDRLCQMRQALLFDLLYSPTITRWMNEFPVCQHDKGAVHFAQSSWAIKLETLNPLRKWLHAELSKVDEHVWHSAHFEMDAFGNKEWVDENDHTLGFKIETRALLAPLQGTANTTNYDKQKLFDVFGDWLERMEGSRSFKVTSAERKTISTFANWKREFNRVFPSAQGGYEARIGQGLGSGAQKLCLKFSTLDELRERFAESCKTPVAVVFPLDERKRLSGADAVSGGFAD